mmetsp:Transcript_25682/g.64482  ORF Transcript_25682/g.64482 Transcript_25682/m.64482 type:complete len:493 (+) Transcript_25682:445-1923(+)
MPTQAGAALSDKRTLQQAVWGNDSCTTPNATHFVAQRARPAAAASSNASRRPTLPVKRDHNGLAVHTTSTPTLPPTSPSVSASPAENNPENTTNPITKSRSPASPPILPPLSRSVSPAENSPDNTTKGRPDTTKASPGKRCSTEGSKPCIPVQRSDIVPTQGGVRHAVLKRATELVRRWDDSLDPDEEDPHMEPVVVAVNLRPGQLKTIGSCLQQYKGFKFDMEPMDDSQPDGPYRLILVGASNRCHGYAIMLIAELFMVFKLQHAPTNPATGLPRDIWTTGTDGMEPTLGGSAPDVAILFGDLISFVVEVENKNRNMPALERVALRYFQACPTLQGFLAIKRYPTNRNGHIMALAVLYERPAGNITAATQLPPPPQNRVVSFGTAPVSGRCRMPASIPPGLIDGANTAPGRPVDNAGRPIPSPDPGHVAPLHPDLPRAPWCAPPLGVMTIPGSMLVAGMAGSPQLVSLLPAGTPPDWEINMWEVLLKLGRV